MGSHIYICESLRDNSKVRLGGRVDAEQDSSNLASLAREGFCGTALPG